MVTALPAVLRSLVRRRVAGPVFAAAVAASSAAAVVPAAHAAGPAAQAAEPAAVASATLERIRTTGEIRLGHRDVSVPFSYLDGDHKPVGFAMDLCARIVDAVRVRLALPGLRATLHPVQLGNQIPLIQNGTVDIICGPTTNTVERQRVVSFSNTIFVASIRAVVRRDGPVQRFDDLAGRAVALTAGSTSIALLAEREKSGGFQTRHVPSPDHGASFLALSSGRTDAFVMDDVLLAGLVAASPEPGRWRLIDDALRSEPYGLVVRKADPAFKSVVDETLAALVADGGFERLYAKWFTSPIPPNGIDLALPMSPALRHALQHPNDRGV